MALTPFRWIAMAAIGCMLVILAVVSLAQDSQNPPWYSPQRRVTDTAEERLRDIAGRLNQTSQNLAFRYHMLYLVDSVRRVADRAPDTGAVRVFIGDVYPPPTRAAIDKTIRDARGLRRGDAGRVDVFIIHDTTSSVRGIPRSWVPTEIRYEIPARAGDRCRVFVTAGTPSTVPSAFNSEKSSEQLLGPCGFFAAFGEPGPLVRQWLLGGGWQYAIDGSWTSPPYIPALREGPSIFKGPSVASGMLIIGSGGIECIKGEMNACERTMASRVSRRASQPANLTPPSGLGKRRYFQGTVGYQASGVLSSAVRELGRERFKAFWSSTDSVSIGFQKASGERWGEFIRRWMIAHYGEVHPGPRMSSFAMLASTILVFAAVGLTMLISVKRTYV
jgi:hypothetical protein